MRAACRPDGARLACTLPFTWSTCSSHSASPESFSPQVRPTPFIHHCVLAHTSSRYCVVYIRLRTLRLGPLAIRNSFSLYSEASEPGSCRPTPIERSATLHSAVITVLITLRIASRVVYPKLVSRVFALSYNTTRRGPYLLLLCSRVRAVCSSR